MFTLELHEIMHYADLHLSLLAINGSCLENALETKEKLQQQLQIEFQIIFRKTIWGL